MWTKLLAHRSSGARSVGVISNAQPTGSRKRVKVNQSKSFDAYTHLATSNLRARWCLFQQTHRRSMRLLHTRYVCPKLHLCIGIRLPCSANSNRFLFGFSFVFLFSFKLTATKSPLHHFHLDSAPRSQILRNCNTNALRAKWAKKTIDGSKMTAGATSNYYLFRYCIYEQDGYEYLIQKCFPKKAGFFVAERRYF